MAKKQARIKDIAQLAGVSTGTVDRVLHNRGEVSGETRKKILSIIDSLDYQPNFLASTLASKKEYHFAVLIPAGSDHNPYWLEPLKGILKARDELSSYGVRISIYSFLHNTTDFRKKADSVLEAKPDALLLAPIFYSESKRFLASCKKIGLPLVFIDTQMEYEGAIRFIGQNSCQAGHVAARLMDLGQPDKARYLAFNLLGEKDQLYHFTERLNGFKDFFKSHNKDVQITVFDIHAADQDPIEEILKKHLEQENPIHGIFVTGSKVYRIARVLKGLTVRRPRLVGFDLVPENIEYLREEMIDFLISQQPEEQAYTGIQTLYSVIVLKQNVDPVKYSAIDIITRENLSDYLQCQ